MVRRIPKTKFDLHAGLMKSAVHTEPSVGSVASPPVVVEEPLMPSSPTSGTDRVNTAFIVQSVSFDKEVVNSDHSLSVAVAHLESCASKANMMIHDVPGDGNCLYWSILYQLKARGVCTASVSELREMTTAYLESHSDFYSHFIGESIPATNPMNADTEALDDDDAHISLIPDPRERSQARWFKYLERIRHSTW